MESNPTEWLKQLFEKEAWSEEDRRRLLEYLDNTNDLGLRELMEQRFNEDAARHRPDQAGTSGLSQSAGTDGSTHPNVPPGTEERLLAMIHEKIAPPAAPAKYNARIFSLAGWKKWAVAALLLLVAGKFLLDRYAIPRKPLSTPDQPVIANGDRPPGTQNATLTLADGTVITLDSAANGSLAQQGSTKVIKLNGQIAYSDRGGGREDVPLLNTIATARGNQYMLVLSDGSKVWLNAASSMRFPTSFKGGERKVEITGEAFFEIADNPSMPFKVVAGGGEIQVLGTHFNVNAYTDESTVKTTLLEGAVAVRKEQSRLVLSPGQQAMFNPKSPSGQASNAITVLKDVDTGQETAWKDGFFWFNNTDIHTLMRQVSRWYDVEVAFEGNITDDGFSGKVSRSLPLSKLLKVLEQYEIHFKVEGKRITVLP